MSAKLFLNTASVKPEICIFNDDEKMFSYVATDTQPSESILEIIASGVFQSNLEPENIKKIYYISGPGSFTGLRIGVTIVQIWQTLHQVRVFSVDQLTFLGILSTKAAVETILIPAGIEAAHHVYRGTYKGKLPISRLAESIEPGTTVMTQAPKHIFLKYQAIFPGVNFIEPGAVQLDDLKQIAENSTAISKPDIDYYAEPHITKPKK